MPRNPSSPITTNVTVRIFQYDQNSDGDVIIRIEDSRSHVQVAEITMSANQMAGCLIGQREGKATCEWRGLDLVGKRYEHKEISVPHPKEKYRDKELARAEIHESVKHHLVDGWFIAHDGLSSQQNGKEHSLGLGRYVDDEGGE